jgi:hypothetical protein
MEEDAFQSSEIKIPFVEGYTVCSGIVPDPENAKKICFACELKLQSSYKFRELCRASYQTLKDKTELVAMYVHVKHEIPSDNEMEFSNDNLGKKGDKKTKARPFSQVYVRDVNLELPKTRKSTRKSSIKPNSSLLPKDVVNENVLLKEEKIEDDNKDIVVSTKKVRGPYRQKVPGQRLKRAKREPKLKKQPPPVLKVADMDSNFQCPHCDTVLRTYNEFLKHREANHKVGGLFQNLSRVCGLCNTEVKQFVEHIAESHKDYRPCFCNYCDKGKFQTPVELRAHMYSHLCCEATHECLSCHDMFRSEGYLRTHISNFHRNINNTYLCPYCGLEFLQFAECHAHFRQIHETEQMAKKKMFPCFNCKKIYMFGKYYVNHDCSKRNTDYQPPPIKYTNTVKCGRCDLKFSCPDELECHNSRGCDEDLQANKCIKCNKCFETRYKFVKHRRTHTETKNNYVCDLCGFAGQSASILKNHMLRHVTERPYKCHLCEATFKTDRFLIIHQRVHDENRPYECFLCLRRFRSYLLVKSHMAVHSDSSLLRKCTCEICGKMTTNRRSLKSHMITHTRQYKVSIQMNIFCLLS